MCSVRWWYSNTPSTWELNEGGSSWDSPAGHGCAPKQYHHLLAVVFSLPVPDHISTNWNAPGIVHPLTEKEVELTWCRRLEAEGREAHEQRRSGDRFSHSAPGHLFHGCKCQSYNTASGTCALCHQWSGAGTGSWKQETKHIIGTVILFYLFFLSQYC